MASIDLKDAYYSAPIRPDRRKLLRFVWENKVFEYNALPNGLAMAPRLFTKLLKQVFACLRSAGHISRAFLDDSLLIGNRNGVHNQHHEHMGLDLKTKNCV